MDVIITDDSLMFRSAISSALSEVDGLNIIEKFSDGRKLVDYFQRGGRADIVILDLEMPVLNGIEALVEIRKLDKDVKIIMFSSVTVKGAEKTLEALRLGADDFVPKVEGSGGLNESLKQIADELVPKILALGGSPKRAAISTASSSKVESRSTVNSNYVYLDDKTLRPDLLCIGSSTGGPDALLKVFSHIKNIPSFPILLVQHMPPIFTAKLAASLNEKAALEVVEAKEGDVLRNGVCYVAPGDFHMRIKRVKSEYVITLDQGEKVCHVRPSVDVMLDSVTECFSGKVATLIMTGMGSDGANGCEKQKKITDNIYIQDEESSVVWGMPGAVFRKNIGAKIIPLKDIGPFLNMISGN